MLSDYYQLLGIKPTATNQEIKLAYRSLAKKHHPDKTLGDRKSEEFFKEIIEAYTVLINPEKRKNYDLKRAYATNAKLRNATYQTKSQTQFNQQRTPGKHKAAAHPAPKIKLWVYVVAASIIILGIVMAINYPKYEYADYELALEELNKAKDSLDALKSTPTTSSAEIFNNPTDSNGYYPYFNYFGRGLYDKLAKTTITIVNNTPYDAILLLIDNKLPNVVVRNHYLKKGSVCYMLHIPNGVYFIRAYFGEHWNADKAVLVGSNVQGGFDNEAGYFQFNRRTDLIIANQYQQGKNSITTNYQTLLLQLLNDKGNKITAANFWEIKNQ